MSFCFITQENTYLISLETGEGYLWQEDCEHIFYEFNDEIEPINEISFYEKNLDSFSYPFIDARQFGDRRSAMMRDPFWGYVRDFFYKTVDAILHVKTYPKNLYISSLSTLPTSGGQITICYEENGKRIFVSFRRKFIREINNYVVYEYDTDNQFAKMTLVFRKFYIPDYAPVTSIILSSRSLNVVQDSKIFYIHDKRFKSQLRIIPGSNIVFKVVNSDVKPTSENFFNTTHKDRITSKTQVSGIESPEQILKTSDNRSNVQNISSAAPQQYIPSNEYKEHTYSIDQMSSYDLEKLYDVNPEYNITNQSDIQGSDISESERVKSSDDSVFGVSSQQSVSTSPNTFNVIILAQPFSDILSTFGNQYIKTEEKISSKYNIVKEGVSSINGVTPDSQGNINLYGDKSVIVGIIPDYKNSGKPALKISQPQRQCNSCDEIKKIDEKLDELVRLYNQAVDKLHQYQQVYINILQYVRYLLNAPIVGPAGIDQNQVKSFVKLIAGKDL